MTQPLSVLLLGSGSRYWKIATPLESAGAEVEAVVGRGHELFAKFTLRRFGQSEYDVVIADSYSLQATVGLWIAARHGAAFVLRLRDDPMLLEGRRSRAACTAAAKLMNLTSAGDRLFRHNILHSAGLIPVSAAIGASIRQRLPAYHGAIIPVGTPMKQPRRPREDEIGEALKKADCEGKRLICSVTNFDFWDKVSPMLEAARGMASVLDERGAVWAIAGRGIHADRFFEELGGKCPSRLWRRLGFVNVWPFLFAADTFLHLSRLDGLPTVILEAQAAGCPVVANAFGGITECIEHGANGLLLQDVVEASDAIDKLLTHPKFAAKLAERGRRQVLTDYSVQSIGEKMLSALREIIATHKRAAG